MEERPLPEGLDRCEDEQISRPGVVQPHGVMFALDPDNLVVRHVSENSEAVLNRSPESLVGVKITELVAASNRESLEGVLKNKLNSYSNPLSLEIGLEGEGRFFDGIASRAGELILLELDGEHPGNFQGDASRRSLEHHFELTSSTLMALAGSDSVAAAGQSLCENVKEFLGFDRVMLYVFADDGHGEVLAEARENELSPFLGLHYPASDIPENARQLYVQNLIRLIADVDAVPVDLYPPNPELDMTHATLRAVSPFHIRYLQNMGVTASMSISLVEGGKLWGLIACHHYSGPFEIPATRRISCVHLAMAVAGRLAAIQKQNEADQFLQRKDRLTRKIITLSKMRDLPEAFSQRAKGILDVFLADGLTFLSDRKDLTHGHALDPLRSRQLLKYLSPKSDGIQMSNSLRADFPSFEWREDEPAGVLVLRFGSQATLLLFRSERVSNVRWAGKQESKEDGPLTPRASFEEWVESVEGRCLEWSETDLRLASEFYSSLATHVLRQLARLNELNAKLKEQNDEIQQFAYTVSHDLKAPLVSVNGWIGVLEEDLEAGEYGELSHAIKRIRTAASRMGNLIEDLLEYSRIGRSEGQVEEISLNEMLRELAGTMETELEEKGIELRIQPDLPTVRGLTNSIYQIFLNLLSNAVKYGSSHSQPVIEVSCETTEFAVRCAVRDNGDGIAPEYHQKIFELFQRLSNDGEGTGVGLASVAKNVQIHHGECGVISLPDSGAEFWFTLPHKHPDNHEL